MRPTDRQREINRRSEAKRRANGKANTYLKTYRRTKRGYLKMKYQDMKQRIKKLALYKGLPIIGPEEFLIWAYNQEEFHLLWEQWVDSGYLPKYSPSIDRLDSQNGYIIENMRFLSMQENSRRGGLWRKT